MQRVLRQAISSVSEWVLFENGSVCLYHGQISKPALEAWARDYISTFSIDSAHKCIPDFDVRVPHDAGGETSDSNSNKLPYLVTYRDPHLISLVSSVISPECRNDKNIGQLGLEAWKRDARDLVVTATSRDIYFQL